MHIPIDTSLDDVMLTSFRCHAGGVQLLGHQSVLFIQPRVFLPPCMLRAARPSNIVCALTQAAGTKGTRHRRNRLRALPDTAVSNRPNCARLEHPQASLPVQRRQRSQSCSKTDNLPGKLRRASTATEARFRCGELHSVAAMGARPRLRLQDAVWHILGIGPFVP
ncbi:hypothetical protein BD311DRAFT_765995 [Dichomitus squalens]|uniref:Uncharacterized protein n=1 Tax=Dichomitus squalens TaxID=114155 RepID=A0A4Q9MFT9_9APHY|nr:hypothetical protein BD311DRAFT_765995 [Dichomitus squalens]